MPVKWNRLDQPVKKEKRAEITHLSITDTARFKHQSHTNDLIRCCSRNRNTRRISDSWQQRNNCHINANGGD